MVKYAQYRAAKSLDHKQGKGHPKFALGTIFFVCQDRFETAGSLRKNKPRALCLCPLSFFFSMASLP